MKLLPCFGPARPALWFALFPLLVVSLLAAEPVKTFDVAAGDAATTLKQAAKQGGVEIVIPAPTVAGVKTSAVKGEFTAREALNRMLAGTDLVLVQDEKTGALTVNRLPVEAKNAPSRPADAEAADSADAGGARIKDGIVRLDTFEVMGGKVLNMDVARSRDDTQPYVIFDRVQIQNTGAANIEEFFRARVPMDTMTRPSTSNAGTGAGRSAINLRGLGANQTLILVDGRRLPQVAINDLDVQPDLNAIPVSSIERIEILPATASGIYGGSATGGVVNIILRRDYVGAELVLNYDNTFSTDTARERVDFSAGINTKDGKTNLLLAASYRENNSLLLQDRADLYRRGISQIVRNSPGYLFTGRPVMGTQTNILSSNGTPLVLKSGQSLGSVAASIPSGYRGYALDGGAPLLATAGKLNLDMALNSAQAGGGRYVIANSGKVYSYSATLRHQFSSKLQVYLEARESVNESRSPYGLADDPSYLVSAATPTNPFNQSVWISVPYSYRATPVRFRSSDRTLSAGVIASLPAEWKMNFDLSYGGSRAYNNYVYLSGARSAITSGTVNPFRDVQLNPIDLSDYVVSDEEVGGARSRLLTAALRAGGPLWQLPAGRITFSTLLERHQRKVDPAVASFFGDFTYFGPRAEYTSSGYVELSVPLIAKDNALPLVQELELQLAGRQDSYRISGSGSDIDAATAAATRSDSKFSSRNPTVGLRWKVSPDLAVRTSWGTGYLAPDSSQLVPAYYYTLSYIGAYVEDPKRGSEHPTGDSLVNFGGRPETRPEKSESRSVGVVFTPRALPDFRLSIDWVSIKKRDNITALESQQYLDLEDALPGVVQRSPAPSGGYSVGPITGIYMGVVNIARAELESYDIQADYAWKTRTLGNFDISAVATRAMHYKTQVLSTDPFVDHAGFVGSVYSLGFDNYENAWPLKWRGSFTLNWRRGAWSAGWSARYIDSYHIDDKYIGPAQAAAQGNGGMVEAVTYHDLFASYRFGAGATGDTGWRAGLSRLLRNSEVQVGVRNVFNTRPPFSYNGWNNGYVSEYADLRVSTYSLTFKKSF